MHKYEIHLHSSGCSKCARSTASEMVRAAKKSGLSGIVFTNHFYRGNTAVSHRLSWEKFVGAYRDDYLEAAKLGASLSIDVIFAVEEHYDGGGHEALIYGLEPEDLISEPALADMDIASLSHFVREKGGLIYCAHPFRDRPYIADPLAEPDMTLFDGIEVYNKFNTPETNELAKRFAIRSGAAVIAGGDIHRAEDIGTSGLAFPERVRTSRELVLALRGGNYSLLIDGDIIEKEEYLKNVSDI